MMATGSFFFSLTCDPIGCAIFVAALMLVLVLQLVLARVIAPALLPVAVVVLPPHASANAAAKTPGRSHGPKDVFFENGQFFIFPDWGLVQYGNLIHSRMTNPSARSCYGYEDHHYHHHHYDYYLYGCRYCYPYCYYDYYY